MEKILITGANGFLGKLIFNKLSNVNILFSLSRTSGDYIISLENKVPVFNQDFTLVIHAAGKAHFVPKTDDEKRQFHEVNVVGTENLLKGLEKVGVPKQFVFISSVSVYGLESGTQIVEEHKLEAKDAYGLSKIQAEELVTKWCIRHNVVCTILRLPLLVGKCPPGNLGEMMKAIDKGCYFNIGGGKAKKSMVLAEDVAEFVPNVAKIGGVFNLTDGYNPSFLELSNEISKQKGKSNPLNLPIFLVKMLGYLGDLLGNKAPMNSIRLKKITSDLTFDDSKARKVAGWNPRNVLDWFGK
ncbi:NAD-dependent epimerase/dehydratase family protein [Flavobacterium sp.]|uniref:NAD-dependent epimerase/dehydratase family protein n=1 Tax=Flavobacterium sp. TaxID=239 RepID=UPI0025C47707|nr:NAD-dependent epimerase/dehydratase family protein [Flavobacterium sp.]MBA4277223.1 UDP-galactose-4-epimerase [Flavobacterium sp.]